MIGSTALIFEYTDVTTECVVIFYICSIFFLIIIIMKNKRKYADCVDV